MHNFYASYEELMKLITDSENMIHNFTANVNIIDVLKELNIALTWCEILGVEYNVTDKEIIENLNPQISNWVSLNRPYYEQRIDKWNFHIESKRCLSIINKINNVIYDKYIDLIISQIKRIC